MIRSRIVKKLFLITTTILLIFLGMQFVFQYFYFEDFYLFSKKNRISEEIRELKRNIENNSEDINIDEQLVLFSEENNAVAGIVNVYGIPQYGLYGESVVSNIIIENGEGQEYVVYIEHFLLDPYFQFLVEQGDEVSVIGQVIYNEGIYVYPTSITIGNEKFDSSMYNLERIEITPALDESAKGEKISRVKGNREELIRVAPSVGLEPSLKFEPTQIELMGVITERNIAKKVEYSMEYKRNILLNQMIFFNEDNRNLNDIFTNQELIYYSQVDSYTGINNMFFIQPLILSNEEPMFLIAVTSLQPINEALGILEIYFLITFIIAIFFAVIAAYNYSKLIAKPLININNATKQMVGLDFSVKCNVSSKDELGELARNINQLSDELSDALDKVHEINDELRKDIEAKEELEEFRKSFIANVSHELKTPLTVIKAISEGMRDQVYDRNDNKYLNEVLKEINGMNQLVLDLLQSSKMETDITVLKEDIFQLSNVILKVHEDLKPLVKRKCLQVELNLDDGFVLGNEDDITTVIKNFYSNSIKYSDHGAQIRIGMFLSGENCICTIENSGVTIGANELDKIWEPFYVIEKSRNKDLVGTGLGLYIVKQILDRHGSDYEIENTSWGVKAYFTLKIIKE